ncbi:hypothetical protein Rhow_008396 [Rhodococcus wratislaviensis]|uniref:Uncharacterized protein n=1 Tax=Rhodococcus wratislaviensis TaxID=44752 RepID=A0A402CKM7_RHOWR|nr:hypothetical protein [Rhodococcus wratislaviensis]GCE44098.1 hypothetical protein Rhow_008396 [Rhodococcus wratislaviensis]
MASDDTARVRYFPGQFLRTPDFTDEQQYHLAMRRRHNIGHHTMGIVTGLAIALQDGRPVVEPGMAVDGYGRELLLVQRTPLDAPRAFTARNTDRLDVWLAYNLVAGDPAPEGYASCAPGEETSYRLVEHPLLRYTVPDPDETDRRRPATVSEGDRDFGPERTPPDDPIHDWPVFLGSVTRHSQDGKDIYTIDPDDRPYAGLVGEEIRAPSGRTSVQVGAEQEGDPYRFAVRVRGVSHSEVPRLAVLQDGGVAIVGETSLLGNVEVQGVIEITAGPAVARPWTISHVADDKGRHELRMEMDGPLGAADSEVVIGTWTTPDGSEEPQFSRCLTIGSETVTVHGDLVVKGKLLDKYGDQLELGDSALDDTAEAGANAAHQGGMGVTTGIVGSLYKPPPDPSEPTR